MRDASYAVKHYRSARQRHLIKIIEEFFSRQFPKYFGPVIVTKIAQELMAIFDAHTAESGRLRHGQILWTALDKRTRGDSPKRRFVPVILSLVTEEDVAQLEMGVRPAKIAEDVIGRIMKEAYEQGGILSTRDVALIMQFDCRRATTLRQNFERTHNIVLPHTGTLHDMGSCITHKKMILKKILLEKKDPSQAARESNHTQAAVDRYLKDYHRVQTVYEQNTDPDYIRIVTGISTRVVKQYIQIHNLYSEKA